jgi:hypothetical protein
MNTLHKGQYDTLQFEPNEGQRGLLCSNRASLRCPSLSSSSALSKETLEALEELGTVLRGIHKRIVREGYQLKDGCIQKKSNNEYFNQKQNRGNIDEGNPAG